MRLMMLNKNQYVNPRRIISIEPSMGRACLIVTLAGRLEPCEVYPMTETETLVELMDRLKADFMEATK